jgi:cysteine sulfinate desulfinase/cysteine desulfurase-like protein
VAKLLGARSSEIVFTSGGTEGDNLALFGLAKSGDHIVTSSIEHHAVLNSSKRLVGLGCEITYVPVDGRCLVDPDDVRRALRPSTKLISVMMANNETGVLQPVEEIGRIAAEAGVYFHTDAVQAAGKVPINVERIGCDLLSISGHKMHAPQGTGAVYVRAPLESWFSKRMEDGTTVYWSNPELPESRKANFRKVLSELKPGTWVMVTHPGLYSAQQRGTAKPQHGPRRGLG